MDLELEQETHDLEESHWWYRERRRMIEGVLERMRLPAQSRILDAGCGSGRNMELLARFGAPTGVEPAEQSAEVARARGVGRVVQGSLDARLAFESASFDLVVCLDVLEHIADDRAALRELRRVSAADGRLLVTVPAHDWLWGAHDDLSGHQRRYTRASLLSVAADVRLAAALGQRLQRRAARADRRGARGRPCARRAAACALGPGAHPARARSRAGDDPRRRGADHRIGPLAAVWRVDRRAAGRGLKSATEGRAAA